MKISMQQCRVVLCTSFIFMLSSNIQAANQNFQNFMYQACANPSGTLATRCGEGNQGGGTQDGDLSGDSEDSLNPSQALSYNANAIAETSARIKALIERMKTVEAEQKIFTRDVDREAMQVFRMSGSSILVQIEGSDYDRDLTDFERGYEKEGYGVKLGADYRITDDWLAGIMLGYDYYDQTFDQDKAGANFNPLKNEGESEASNYSIALFTSKNFGERYYLEGLVSYIYSDYEFDRNVIFQNSVRNTFTNVHSKGKTDGDQVMISLGAGMTLNKDALNVTPYTRLDYQKSWIDEYTEKGNNSGLEMTIDDSSYEEFTGTLGFRVSHNVNMDFGILMPQVYVEWQHAFTRDRTETSSYFNLDNNRTVYTVKGDDPDDDSGVFGVSLLAGLPDGWMAYLGANTEFGRSYVEHYRINAGLRIEF